MTEWRELKTGLEVFQALDAGDEVQVEGPYRGLDWTTWYIELGWSPDCNYRARPRKTTKTVVLREALLFHNGTYWTYWTDSESMGFVRWLDTPERVVEVEE